MKQFLTILLISAGIFGFSTTTNAQKIGYISADEIIQLMPEAATVQHELDQYQQSLYQNAQDKQNAFNESLQKFLKDSSTMSPSLKEVKRGDLQKQQQELAGEQQRIQSDFEQKRQELSAPIQKKLQNAIEEVAKENGYTYVMPREALIVMPTTNDLGPLVIKKLGLKQPSTTVPAKK
ncbi:MAG TPA: OmpH family outer membrane protein [Hanamia sp.]|jgi:outer membrane protein|nr:OmpH family outer membrane protein [Hanamia sp.]